MPKSDGGIHLIVSLKTVIEFVRFAHFKMESSHTILELDDTWLLDALHGLEGCLLQCKDPSISTI